LLEPKNKEKMKMKKILACTIIGIFLFCNCNSAFCSDELGYVKQENITLNLVDSIAVFDESSSKLSIYLLPTKLAEEDKNDIKEMPKFAFAIFADQMSPNEEIWQWYPYITLNIKFDKEKRSYDIDDIKHYSIVIYGIKDKNLSPTYNRSPSEDLQDTFKEYNFDIENKKIALNLSGKWNYDGDELEWNFKINTEVIFY